MDRGVDRYIEKQRSPQREICQRLRRLILKTYPGISEEMRMGVPWYEGRYYIVALRDHVNLGFLIKGLSKKEMGLLEGSGKIMRHIKIRNLKDLDEKKVTELLRMTKGARKEACRKK